MDEELRNKNGKRNVTLRNFENNQEEVVKLIERFDPKRHIYCLNGPRIVIKIEFTIFNY